mgnify:CR=1 FL=1
MSDEEALGLAAEENAIGNDLPAIVANRKLRTPNSFTSFYHYRLRELFGEGRYMNRVRAARLWWMRHAGVTLLTLFAASAGIGCGSSTDPGDLAPPLGSYDYSFTLPFVVSVVSETQYTGAMVLTFASRDSIAGSWNVPTGYRPAFQQNGPGYEARMALGFKNAGAYVVFAYPISGGTITHRLTPTEAGFACDAGWLYLDRFGIIQRVNGVCGVFRR